MLSHIRRLEEPGRLRVAVTAADVGIIDVAWMRKEEHSTRQQELTKDRLNEIKALDEEFQEVIESDEEKQKQGY